MRRYMIIRDYLTAFWLLPEVSTRDPIISLRALARGLIMVEGKPCVIICLSHIPIHYFNAIVVQKMLVKQMTGVNFVYGKSSKITNTKK